MFCTWLSEFCKKLKLQGMVIYWDKYNKNAFLQANYRIKSYFCNNFWKIQWLPLCFFISKKNTTMCKTYGNLHNILGGGGGVQRKGKKTEVKI